MSQYAPEHNRLKAYIDGYKLGIVKLHLGCGGIRWRDFINVDMYPAEAGTPDSSRIGCVADVFADMRKLGLANYSVDEIFTSHTIDHFPRWEAIDMFRDWYRMLKPDGLLVIEAADFVRCVLWLLHPNRSKRISAKNQFYGNQWDRIDFETHRYLWSARELVGVLRDIGFRKVSFSHATLTHHPGRDMHVEAVK
ncbi:MAG: methyltransferase domain-containing protein [Candidatus Competibacteraceae bacterium]|nr:MAG: methyltransferase domain-containing protein [Candidatus Competibacteraceae bacterium]